MRRLPIVVLLMVALLAPGLVAAQDATPEVSMAERPLDLAAIVLNPADLEALGLSSFGIQGTATFPIEGVDAYVADFGRSEEERDALAAAGWLRRYDIGLSAPVEPPQAPPHDIGIAVDSYVTEYASAAGAAAGFALLEDGTSGEEPAIARGQDAYTDDDTGETVTYQYLDVVFRVENLTAGVAISTFNDEEPDLALAEALIARLREKIAAAHAGETPGLGPRLLLLAGPEVSTVGESYTRLDGEILPFYGQTAADIAASQARQGASTDAYGGRQILSITNDGEGTYVPRLLRFADEAEASAWLDGALMQTEELYGEVLQAPDSGQIGDESLTLEIPSFGTPARSGYAVFARVGPEVAALEIFAPSGVPQPVAEALLAAQVAWLQVSTACAPISMPSASDLVATPSP